METLMSARLSAIAGLFLAAVPTVLLGQTSEEYAAMGQKLWAAFECGALAEHAGRFEESTRLYKMGYDHGKTLLDAFRAGKVDEQARGKLPPAVLFMLDGEGQPSISSLGGYLRQPCKIRASSFLKRRTTRKHKRL
jgi:hypothetical protein